MRYNIASKIASAYQKLIAFMNGYCKKSEHCSVFVKPVLDFGQNCSTNSRTRLQVLWITQNPQLADNDMKDIAALKREVERLIKTTCMI